VTEHSSALCLACGLCCIGALHGTVEVKAEDVAPVRSLGLTVEPVDGQAGQHGFRQPCPLYLDDRCSVYGRHPRSCHEYRCALLKKLAAGEVELGAALSVVHEAKSLIAESAAVPVAQRGRPDALLCAAALEVLLTRRFREP
jgi:Fe-S-cluster containining protein